MTIDFGDYADRIDQKISQALEQRENLGYEATQEKVQEILQCELSSMNLGVLSSYDVQSIVGFDSGSEKSTDDIVEDAIVFVEDLQDEQEFSKYEDEGKEELKRFGYYDV